MEIDKSEMEIGDKLFKIAVYERCLSAIQSRIANAEQALQQAREASQDDTKSSAGDKYETTREMMQQDIDRNEAQLFEANKKLFQLEQCKETDFNGFVKAGSIVKTSKALLYVSVGVGQLNVEGHVIFAISPASPIGQVLLGKAKGDTFVFNGITQTVEELY